MTTTIIDNCDNLLYDKFLTLYKTSFPPFEQRSERQQKLAFENENYRLVAFFEKSLFIGFVAYWELMQMVYIEHFAVDTSLRSNGYGRQILEHLNQMVKGQIVLEIDPVVDEISASRLRFYQKCGFVENSFDHIHPPYVAGEVGHRLVVLSFERQLSENEFVCFRQELTEVVMKGC